MLEIKHVYEQIRDYIKRELEDLKPGDFLNTEVGYSTLFSVSRPTVRKAVTMLIKEGLLHRVPGKGLVVSAQNDKEIERRKSIAFILPYMPEDGFFYSVLSGCIEAANKKKYDYTVFNKADIDDEILDIIKTSKYEGIIMTAYTEKDVLIVKELKKLGISVVLVDNYINNVDVPFVLTNDYQGGYLLTDYLIKQGHKQILYINSMNEVQTVKDRKQGYMDALKNSEIPLSDQYIINLDNHNVIYDILTNLDIPYTAVCGYSDLVVIMAQNLILHKGIKIPEEVSLAGYGNLKASEMTYPPLTTVSVPVTDMGKKAVDLLADSLNGKDHIENIILPVKLLERKSVQKIL